MTRVTALTGVVVQVCKDVLTDVLTGVVLQMCKDSTQEVQAGESGQGYPWLQN